MGKRDGLIPSLASLLAKARPLHEWTRANATELDVYKSLTKAATDKSDPRRHHAKVDAIIRNHDALNKFFVGLGFPSLPADHILTRHWESQISQVRKQEQRMLTQGKRRKLTKQSGANRSAEATFRQPSDANVVIENEDLRDP